MATKISDSITYVGIDDLSTRLFEAQYPTPKGMSYNSYVILDDRIAVMDSVEAGGGEAWIADILAATERREPDFLVVHHMEPDHSACILQALERFPNLTLVASAPALKMVPQFFPEINIDGRTLTVKEGSELDLGHHKLTFYTAPMVHWPEVLVSYESTSRTLFSADAFGKFGAIQAGGEWTDEARRYYINIVGRYGAQVQSLLKKLMPVTVDRIAPLHGPVLDAPLDKYLGLYDAWSSYRPETRGVLVAYASIYGGTAEAALELADKLRSEGVEEIVTIDLTTGSLSEAVAQAFRMSHIVLASATYDAGLFPAMHDFIHHLNLKNFRNRTVGYIENGSWAPVAAKRMSALMATMPDIVDLSPVVTVRSRLDAASRAKLHELDNAVKASLANG